MKIVPFAQRVLYRDSTVYICRYNGLYYSFVAEKFGRSCSICTR